MDDRSPDRMQGVRRLKLAAEVALEQGRDKHAYKFLEDALQMLGPHYTLPGAMDDTRIGHLAAQDLHRRGDVRRAAEWLMTVLTTRLRLLGLGEQKAGRQCPSCGATNPEGDPFCGQCGSPMGMQTEAPAPRSATVMCPQCGRAVPLGKKFCAWCGTPRA